MGRIDSTPPPQSSDDQSPIHEPPQGYPNHHDNPPPPPVHHDPNVNHLPSTRSFVPSSPENIPPPQSYPPQKPASYPPQQSPASYPPQQSPASYPPQQSPASYPPQQPRPVQFPPQPQPQAVQFQPQQQTSSNPQSYNYAYSNAQPQVNYQTPVKTEGIAVGSQYLAPTQGWRDGLFDCANDPENAIMTFCFPCVTFGQIAEIVDNGQTSCATSGLIYSLIAAFVGIPCIMSCSYRTKVRSRYNLIETPAPDWVIHWFCEYCALCQEYRELKNRGMDPALGWQGNLSRQQQMANGVTMAPPINQRMMG